MAVTMLNANQTWHAQSIPMGTGSLSMLGMAPVTSAVGMAQAAVRPRRQPTQFEICIEAAKVAAHPVTIKVDDKQDFHFSMITAGDLIEIFGKLKPMYGGKPQAWAQMLLNSAPSFTSPRSKTAARHMVHSSMAGLFYALPPIIGKRRRRFRLTASALMLLDHWSEKHPAFKPFVAAYVSKKSRKEINVDTMDLTFGFVGASLKKELDKAKVAQDKKDAADAVDLAAQMKIYHQQMSMNNRYSAMPSAQGIGTGNQLAISNGGIGMQTAVPYTASLLGQSTSNVRADSRGFWDKLVGSIL